MGTAAGRLAQLRLNLASLSGLARLRELRSRGLGAIVRFQQVRPRKRQPFQPLSHTEITPQFLDQAITAIRRWGYEIVSVGDVVQRLGDPAAQRFVALTFDTASRDVVTHAWPVLSRQAAPFALYAPTAFLDGFGCDWQPALAQAISKQPRLHLMIGQDERRFMCESLADKYEAYAYLSRWLRSLAPASRRDAINDLCKRYGVDLASLSRDNMLAWSDLEMLAASALVTIGTTTVDGASLAGLPAADAQREMRMGRAVAEAALRRTLPHFAYPDGASDSFGRREIAIAGEQGFVTAVTGLARTLTRGAPIDPLAMPRLTWDGRITSLRVLRAMMAGLN